MWRMSLTATLSPSKVSRKSVPSVPKTVVHKDEFSDVAAKVRSVLMTYEAQPQSDGARAEVRRVLAEAANVVLSFPRSSPQDPAVLEVRGLIRTVADSGVWDHPLDAAEISAMSEWPRQGWPGILAGMLFGPAWQSPNAPALDVAPDWLWGDYAEWLFTVPQRFTALGQTAAYAAYLIPRMENLLRWVE